MHDPKLARGLCIPLFVGSLVIGSNVSAQTLSPYADFQAMSTSDLVHLQVKFTYVGPRKHGYPSLAFTTTGQSLNVSAFTPYYRSGFPYDEDDDVIATFTASTQEMHDLIADVGTLSSVTAGGVASGGDISFSMLNVISGVTKCFEAVVTTTTGKALFGQVLVAMQNNTSARRDLANYACAMGMGQGTPSTDVSSQTSVRLRGLRFDRIYHRYVGSIRVTNTSQQSISAPLILVLDVGGSAALMAPDGYSCGTASLGAPFVKFLSSGSLGAGQFAEKTVAFDNPDNIPIVLKTMRVLAGGSGQ